MGDHRHYVDHLDKSDVEKVILNLLKNRGALQVLTDTEIISPDEMSVEVEVRLIVDEHIVLSGSHSFITPF